MRETFLQHLRCPVDQKTLTLQAGERADDGHIMSGSLQCSDCKRDYAIKDGVPCMLPEEAAIVDGVGIAKLQNATIERFGFEWRLFRDWGWHESYPDVEHAEQRFFGGLWEHTETSFWGKSLFTKEDLSPGHLLLDAGCGNGRYTAMASTTGVDVIGIDLGLGVYSAFENTRDKENVHIVQGDLFRLPFPKEHFDRIFSIGVLMHTGNAPKAYDSLVTCLKAGGLMHAHVYGKGMWTYEWLDWFIRLFTVRLSISWQMRFAGLTAGIARWFRTGNERRMNIYYKLYHQINLLPTEHHMYDWWSAPIATHHTLDEVVSWMQRNQIEVVRTVPDIGDVERLRTKKIGHGSITALGRKAETTTAPS